MPDSVKFYSGSAEVESTTATNFNVTVTGTGATYNGTAFDRIEADVNVDVIVNAAADSTGGEVTVQMVSVQTYRPTGSAERVTGGCVWETVGTTDLKFTFTPPGVVNHEVSWSFGAGIPPVLFKVVIKRRT
jgi:hypothetical protein